MNERIFDMARQSGATDEQGGRSQEVFCFTKSELSAFAELLIKETRLKTIEEVRRATAQRDSLLEVLKEVGPFLVVLHGPSWALAARKRVRLAIKAVEGGV